MPDKPALPKHIAIIMDGNGRWAKARGLPRVAGHTRGLDVVKSTIETCADKGVDYLTLFAFSSENWRRPADEVGFLMKLFLMALEREVAKLHQHGICLRVVGDLSAFSTEIQALIQRAQNKTQNNTRFHLTICANYGGRWDVMQAMHKAAVQHDMQHISEADYAKFLSMNFAPAPDLFIRTGGEQRISNFVLWDLAYTELHFTEVLWPDFDAIALNHAIESYAQRERRFGRTSEQVQAENIQAKIKLAESVHDAT